METIQNKKPRYNYQGADTSDVLVTQTKRQRTNLEELSAELLHQIISFHSGDNPTIKDVAVLFQSVGKVSKHLRRSCILFCQRFPIDLGGDWQGRYRTIQFLCQNKVKLQSISVNHIWENLRPSLFIYLLQECDLSALESVHIKLAYYYAEKSPSDYAWNEAAEATIPQEVYELEHFFRTSYAVDMYSLQESLKLQVLGTFSHIIKKKENKVRFLDVLVDDWDNSTINQKALEILKSCSSLERMNLIAYGRLGASSLEKQELDRTQESFFAALEEIISSLHISSLCLRSKDFNGELRLKSTSVQELTLDMQACTITGIKCPSLKKLRMGMIGSYGKSFISEFSSPMLESCNIVLNNLKNQDNIVETCHLHSRVISKLININKSLKHLTIEENSDMVKIVRYNLIIESESLEHIDVVSVKNLLFIRRMDCSSLKEVKLPLSFNITEKKMHCPIQFEPVFRQILDQIKRDFLGSEFDFQTIDIPDDCLIKIIPRRI